jgi:hypothetical protein
MTAAEFVERWGMTMSREPVEQGVYVCKHGGFVIRGRATEAKSRRQVTVCRALQDETSPRVAVAQTLHGIARGRLHRVPDLADIVAPKLQHDGSRERHVRGGFRTTGKASDPAACSLRAILVR